MTSATTNRQAHEELLADLRARLDRAALGGGEKARARHLDRGKLLARQRVDVLLDPGSPFLELSPLAAEEMYGGKAPAAGVVAGIVGMVLVAGGFVGSGLGVWLFALLRQLGQIDLVISLSPEAHHRAANLKLGTAAIRRPDPVAGNDRAVDHGLQPRILTDRGIADVALHIAQPRNAAGGVGVVVGDHERTGQQASEQCGETEVPDHGDLLG